MWEGVDSTCYQHAPETSGASQGRAVRAAGRTIRGLRVHGSQLTNGGGWGGMNSGERGARRQHEETRRANKKRW